MAQGETSMRKHKLLIAVIMFGLTWAGIVKAEDQPIEQQLVDAMNRYLVPIRAFALITLRASLSKATSRLLPRQPGLAGPYCSTAARSQRRCDSLIRLEYLTSRTGPPMPIRTAWL